MELLLSYILFDLYSPDLKPPTLCNWKKKKKTKTKKMQIPLFIEQAVKRSIYGRPGAVYIDLPVLYHLKNIFHLNYPHTDSLSMMNN